MAMERAGSGEHIRCDNSFIQAVTAARFSAQPAAQMLYSGEGIGMNRRRRGDRLKRAAVLAVTEESATRPKKRVPRRRKTAPPHVPHTLKDQLFVGRAYEEPMGHDQIETILMQRDFIID